MEYAFIDNSYLGLLFLLFPCFFICMCILLAISLRLYKLMPIVLGNKGFMVYCGRYVSLLMDRQVQAKPIQ